MFRPIMSLRHFKIHPPLPLTPRESTQLLNLLTTSFRQQLDREHGTFRSEADGNVKTSTSPLSNLKLRRHFQSRPDTRMPADRHLHSILSNPLFTDVEKKPDTSGQLLRDPMEIFDEACAKGFMKIEYARACLKAKKQKIVQSSILDVRDAMRSSGAGSQVLRWMVSSGVANDISFLNDETFSEILIDFLVAEELQAVIWTWLEKVCLKEFSIGPTPATTSPFKPASQLFYTLIKAEASGHVSLDTAFGSLGRARDILVSSGYQAGQHLFRQSGPYLCWEIIHGSASRPAPSREMFDNFLSTVRLSKQNFAHVLLYHPTKPDAGLALRVLKDAEAAISAPLNPEIQRVKHHERVISLGLDTARYFLERDQFTKAHWVMNFLQERYGKQLGMAQKIEQARAEASSLELLQSLNVA